MKKLFFIILFLPLVASAHGLVTTQSKQVGQYGVEFEYNTIGNVITGDYTLFDVYLVNPSDLSGMDYDSSFVRISKKNGPAIFAANLATSQDIKGYAGFSTVFNEPGTYVASTNFYKDNKQITTADFEFTVDQSQSTAGSTTSSGNKLFSPPTLVIGSLFLLAIGFFVGTLRTKK